METYCTKKLIIKNKKRQITTYAPTEKGQKQRNFDIEVKEIFEDSYTPSAHSFAYQKGKNVLSNARVHALNSEFLLMDIKNFFPSINHRILEKEIIHQVKMNSTEDLIAPELVNTLLKRLVGNSRQGIQQGLICSPILSDIYLTSFDSFLFESLNLLGKNYNDNETNESSIFNIVYSRYADDITISFSINNIENNESIRAFKVDAANLVRTLLAGYNLKVNEKKTHFISSQESKSVKITGLNLNFNNKKIRVSKKYMNSLYWDTVELFEELRNKNCNIEASLELLEKLIGKESFISSVEPNYFNLEYSERMKTIVYNYDLINLKEMLRQIKKNVLAMQEKESGRKDV